MRSLRSLSFEVHMVQLNDTDLTSIANLVEKQIIVLNNRLQKDINKLMNGE